MTPFEIVPGVDPTELADTSALARVPHHASVRRALLEPLSTGAVAYCDITRLEMGLTARNAQEHIALGALLARLPQVVITREDYDRAWEVQGLLAAVGNHRGVAPPDLLVTACAERLGLTVIDCDADFDVIAEVTGQPTYPLMGNVPVLVGGGAMPDSTTSALTTVRPRVFSSLLVLSTPVPTGVHVCGPSG